MPHNKLFCSSDPRQLGPERALVGFAVCSTLFKVAYAMKRREVLAGRIKSPIWDRLVFNKISKNLGAPLSSFVAAIRLSLRSSPRARFVR
jgi:hypothetical protein